MNETEPDVESVECAKLAQLAGLTESVYQTALAWIAANEAESEMR